VALEPVSNGMQAVPVHGRSNLIFTLIRADGFLRIPPEVTGLRAGAPVQVHVFPGGLAWPAPIGSDG